MRRNEVVIVFNERVLNKCGSLYKTDQGTEIRADVSLFVRFYFLLLYLFIFLLGGGMSMQPERC